MFYMRYNLILVRYFLPAPVLYTSPAQSIGVSSRDVLKIFKKLYHYDMIPKFIPYHVRLVFSD